MATLSLKPAQAAERADDALSAHFAMEAGRVLLEAKLNGRGPYYFYFDTGAPNVITPEVAKDLDIDVHGQGLAVGFGSKQVPSLNAMISLVQIDELSLRDQNFVVMELPHQMVDRGTRPKLAGLIGGDLLHSYAARFDFDLSKISFTRSGMFTYSGGGVPLGISSVLHLTSDAGIQDTPVVMAKIDGHPVSLILDTGSSGGAVFFSRTEISDEIKSGSGSRVGVAAPGGIGGISRSDLMRVGGIEIAGLATGDEPYVEVMGSRLGYAPPSFQSGVLGMAVLARFNLTFDYLHHYMYLEPRAKFPQHLKPESVRATGLQLTKDTQDCFTVLNVVPDSPAEEARLSTGDEIFEVNGVPASDMALFDYRAAERASDWVTITVGSGAHRRVVTLQTQVLLR